MRLYTVNWQDLCYKRSCCAVGDHFTTMSLCSSLLGDEDISHIRIIDTITGQRVDPEKGLEPLCASSCPSI